MNTHKLRQYNIYNIGPGRLLDMCETFVTGSNRLAYFKNFATKFTTTKSFIVQVLE